MKITQATVKANTTDLHKDNWSGYLRADGNVFNKPFTAQRWDGMWDVNIVGDNGDYGLTHSHKTLWGALTLAVKSA